MAFLSWPDGRSQKLRKNKKKLDLYPGDRVTGLDPAPVMKKQAICPLCLRSSTLFALVLGATAGFILIPTRAGPGLPDSQAPSNAPPRALSFQERVAYQRAIEEVYWRHRIWPKENPGPKPPLDAVLSQAQIESKVADYLRKSQALADYWQRPVTASQLQAEMDRMATNTRQPDVLRELFEALGNDPFVIAECLARPALVNRLITNWYAFDQRIHGALKHRAETELKAQPTVAQMKQLGGSYAETELVKGDRHGHKTVRGPVRHVRLGARDWHRTVERLARLFSRNSAAARVPSRRAMQKKEALGIAEIPAGVPSPLQEDETCYYATAILKTTDDCVKLATVSWPKEPLESWLSRAEDRAPTSMVAAGGGYRLPEVPEGASCVENTWSATAAPPDARSGHTAVWTGSEMIIWGGSTSKAELNTGGRYDPSTDTWVATNIAGAPEPRTFHTAVWTGRDMIVWGGVGENSVVLNSGGRYNPESDSWATLSIVSAPEGRRDHTAVWTGKEMIVWGGWDGTTFFDTGGRYNPDTNTWVGVTTTNAPDPRAYHTAIWDDAEMIVWGGGDQFNTLNTGARYNPNTDTWTATSMVNSPDGRSEHSAIWTGTAMVVWGGIDQFGDAKNTGGRYDPNTDTWTATSTANAPDPRAAHSAVWTQSEMVVWGGIDGFGDRFNTGGRYNPDADSWTATSLLGAPDERSAQTAVWTGSEMLVWGGSGYFGELNSGGRYNPSTDSWASIGHTPFGRISHSAVWTGSEMIIWGGDQHDFGLQSNTGAKYEPATDNWTATNITNAPDPRDSHTAVWTGSEMIIWGGDGGFGGLNTGGRYNPSTNSWTATSTTNAPEDRSRHTAIWTGSEMIVWGGIGIFPFDPYLNTGGRYNPIADTWTATSTNDAPTGRYGHSAIWSGSEMIVWGGTDDTDTFDSGGRYNPGTDTWEPTSAANAPSARDLHTAVWTGNEMIVWGGMDLNQDFLNSGGRYNPDTDSWTATSLNNAPEGRAYHTAVWTSAEMIIWGGDSDFFDVNTGARYDPGTDTWVATSTTNAPEARASHTAVWTGSEMIVWGGQDAFSNFLDTGGRYCVQAGPPPTPTPTATSTPTPTTTPTPTATPCAGRCSPTPRPRPTPHPRPIP